MLFFHDMNILAKVPVLCAEIVASTLGGEKRVKLFPYIQIGRFTLNA